jgi:small subunit ribosomal protein S16
MAVRIRMRRVGKRNAPAHRIVVADQRKSRNGRFIETIGNYHADTKHGAIDLARFDYWVSKGAQPTETVEYVANLAREGKLAEMPNSREPKPIADVKLPVEENTETEAQEKNAAATEATEAEEAEAPAEEVAESADAETE